MSRSQIRAGRGQVPDLLPVALAFLTVLGACGSTGGRQRTPAGHVLTLLVQPDGVWREDSLGTREGPLEEAVYVSEFASLHVLLEGGEERELTASLAVVRVTREGRLYLEERLVAQLLTREADARRVCDQSIIRIALDQLRRHPR